MKILHLNFISSHLIQIHRNALQHIIRSISPVYCTLPSDSQVHAANGRSTEYRSVRPLSDFTGHNVLRCFFCSYGMVHEILQAPTLKDAD